MTLQEFLNTTPSSSKERLWLTTRRDGSEVIVSGHERPGGGVSFAGTFGQQLERISETFERSTAFWVEFALQYQRGLNGDQFVFVADGQAYAAETLEQPPGAHLGFGGARMRITSDKWTGVSNSVWFRGHVPPALRELLPDNATLESAA